MLFVFGQLEKMWGHSAMVKTFVRVVCHEEEQNILFLSGVYIGRKNSKDQLVRKHFEEKRGQARSPLEGLENFLG